MVEVSKKDWKLFRERLPEWQEAYMERLTKKYIRLLSGKGDASERFWKLERRIQTDKKKPGVQMELRKQDVMIDLLTLIRDGVITFEELDEFSEDLKDGVRFLKERLG